jgi:hypothetical protein
MRSRSLISMPCSPAQASTPALSRRRPPLATASLAGVLDERSQLRREPTGIGGAQVNLMLCAAQAEPHRRTAIEIIFERDRRLSSPSQASLTVMIVIAPYLATALNIAARTGTRPAELDATAIAAMSSHPVPRADHPCIENSGPIHGRKAAKLGDGEEHACCRGRCPNPAHAATQRPRANSRAP